MFAFSSRLLPLLQLTRMALVFTAIADGACSILLLHSEHPVEMRETLWMRLFAMAGVSIGLYGFGMSLNDIIDRRRDSQISPNRPLPAGRISIFTAHVVCAALAILAVVSGSLYASLSSPAEGRFTFILIVGSGVLITFYDFAGKYLVPLGLLTLGLIRFFHACAPSPQLPVLWHPLLLLNHVTILSTVAYVWEQKRPTLNRKHITIVLVLLFSVNVLAILSVWLRRGYGVADAWQGMAVTEQLVLPICSAVGFLVVGGLILIRTFDQRAAGQKLMLYGLLWLIVYDAAFVTSYVGWKAGLTILMFLPIAYFSVRMMRWWAYLASLTQKSEFKRAGVS